MLVSNRLVHREKGKSEKQEKLSLAGNFIPTSYQPRLITNLKRNN